MPVDIRGVPICRGDIVAAVYEDRLYLGVALEYFDTGAVKVRLYDSTFTEPVVHLYPFPNTQILSGDIYIGGSEAARVLLQWQKEASD